MEGALHVTLISYREETWLEYMRGRRHLGDMATDGSEIYLDEIMVGGPRCGIFESGYEHLGCIEYEEFLG